MIKLYVILFQLNRVEGFMEEARQLLPLISDKIEKE
jgi:hypothetical protein